MGSRARKSIRAYDSEAEDEDDYPVPGLKSSEDLSVKEKATSKAWTKESNVHKIIVGIDFGTTFTGEKSRSFETCCSNRARIGISWVQTAGGHLKQLNVVHVI